MPTYAPVDDAPTTRVGMVGINGWSTHGHPEYPHVHQSLGVPDIPTLHMDMEVLDAHICTSR